MFRLVSLILVFTALFGGGYMYYTALAGCEVPRTYRVGTIDERFNVSEDEVRTAISTAESMWEDGTDRNLFTYDENGEVVINFVYDERQARADEEADFREILDTKEEISDSVKEEYTELVSEYEELRATYHRATQAYESELAAYNREVADWNNRGGAPKDVYDQLNVTQADLAKEEKRLNGIRIKLNSLVREINALGAQGNELITDYNELVENYNIKFSEGSEFTQGEYRQDTITIYEFTSEEELAIVLAHEFGHALGVPHVEGEESVMFHYMKEQDTDTGLTAADRDAFFALCGTKGTLGETVELMKQSFEELFARL